MANKGRKFPAQILNRHEVQRFLASFPHTIFGIRNRALILVYLRAQLRCAEALDLRPHDIDWDECSITVLNGKGGKRRVVGIDHGSLDVIREWDKIRPESEYFFCTARGDRIDNSHVRKLIKKQAVAAGIKKRVHPHLMRHQGACDLAEAKIDVRIISRQLGHSTLAVTDRYLNHLHPREVIAAIRDRQLQ